MQVLLEVWNHCSRQLPSDMKVCSLMEEWGNQARNVKLVMADASSYGGKSTPQTSVHARTWQRHVHLRKKQTHGKVSYRKRRSVATRERLSRRTLGKDIGRLLRFIQAKQEEYERLTSLRKPTDALLDPSAVQVYI